MVLERRQPTASSPEVLPLSAALASGITPSQLRGSYHSLFRGYYVSASAARDHRKRLVAALLIHPPGAFVSPLSAARLYGLPVPHPTDVHVTVPRECDRRSRPGIRSHRNPTGIQVVSHQGLPVSDPVGTSISLGYVLGLVDLVALGDAVVSAGLVTPETLVTATHASHANGVKPARRAAWYVRPRMRQQLRVRVVSERGTARQRRPSKTLRLDCVRLDWIPLDWIQARLDTARMDTARADTASRGYNGPYWVRQPRLGTAAPPGSATGRGLKGGGFSREAAHAPASHGTPRDCAWTRPACAASPTPCGSRWRTPARESC